MSEEMIQLTMSDWLYNAGLVGFLNILQHSEYDENDIKFDGQDIWFHPKLLDEFEEKYFNYFIDTYETTLSWYKIVRFENFIKKHEEDNFGDFTKDDLEKLNNYIGTNSQSGTIKYFIKSNSYKAAYQLIENDLDVENESKKLSKIKLKKNQEIEEVIGEVKDNFETIKCIISYFKLPQAKKYIAGKNIIYTLIRNAWDGVSFLNPQTKEKDMYKDYKNHFIKDIVDNINESNEKFKYNCFTCGKKMRKMDNDLSFMQMTGFDTSRKPSHVWNFVNDISICPLCKLIYSCVPAGFTYVYSRGIFVNENHNISNALSINNRIKTDVLKDEKLNQSTTYKALIRAIQETESKSNKYDLADIQVVRFEKIDDNVKYRFNILSKEIVKVIQDSKNEFEKLITGGFKEVNTYFSVYEEVNKNLLNNENLFPLIHKMIILNLSKPKNAMFSAIQLKSMLKINYNYLKGVSHLEKSENDVLKMVSGSGYWLREEYKKKNSENKLNGIAYRLLNALKTNNRGSFMDTILNCYLYTGKEVPRFFTDCLKENSNEFKTIGYAFVAGMIEGKNNSKKDNGGNE